METLKQVAWKYGENALGSSYVKYQCDLAFREGAEFAQNWIKIDDELPNNDETVITIRKKLNGKTYYHLNSINDGKWNIAIPDTSEITHWRYIDLK